LTKWGIIKMDLMFNTIITTTVTALCILLLKTIFKNKMPPKLHLYIWIILLIRMLLPVFPQSQFSVFNIVPTISNVNVIENERDAKEYLEIDKSTVNQEYITGKITVANYSKSFSIKKNIETIIIYVWLFGALALFFYFLCIYIIFKYKLRSIKLSLDDEIINTLKVYKEKMNIKRDVSIKVYGSTSMLIGIIKPTIILPKGYGQEEISQMIVHELCHLKHNDIILNILSTIVLCLNWYNPIIWICYYIFKTDMEILCDQKVVEIIGNKKNYASLLLKASLKFSFPTPITTSMNNGINDIKRRIYFMANFRKPNALWLIAIIVSIALLAVACLSNKVSLLVENPFSFQNLNSMLGMNKEEVIKTLKINPAEDVTSEIIGDKQETLILKKAIKIDGNDSIVSIIFYNDILTGFSYIFNSIESGYDYVVKIRNQAEEIYGEPSTYPLLDNRLDNLQSVDDINKLDTGARYFEEWTIEAEEELLNTILDGREFDRFTINLEFNCLPNDTSMVTFKYVAVPKSLR